MGDTADLMLDGILCEWCGEFLDEKGVGYPRRCGGCDPIDTVYDEECPRCLMPPSSCVCRSPSKEE